MVALRLCHRNVQIMAEWACLGFVALAALSTALSVLCFMLGIGIDYWTGVRIVQLRLFGEDIPLLIFQAMYVNAVGRAFVDSTLSMVTLALTIWRLVPAVALQCVHVPETCHLILLSMFCCVGWFGNEGADFRSFVRHGNESCYREYSTCDGPVCKTWLAIVPEMEPRARSRKQPRPEVVPDVIEMQPASQGQLHRDQKPAIMSPSTVDRNLDDGGYLNVEGHMNTELSPGERASAALF